MWNWKSKTTYFLIPFFLFWNFIALSFFDLEKAIENPLSLIPIPGIHLIVGILGFLYIALQLINKTTIVVNSKYLSIKHHPIPWGKNHHFSKDQIDYLYVSKAQMSSKKRTWDVPVLQLVKPNDTRQQLLKGTQSVEFADYESLRQRISKALNMPLIGHDHGPD